MECRTWTVPPKQHNASQVGQSGETQVLKAKTPLLSGQALGKKEPKNPKDLQSSYKRSDATYAEILYYGYFGALQAPKPKSTI